MLPHQIEPCSREFVLLLLRFSRGWPTHFDEYKSWEDLIRCTRDPLSSALFLCFCLVLSVGVFCAFVSYLYSIPSCYTDCSGTFDTTLAFGNSISLLGVRHAGRKSLVVGEQHPRSKGAKIVHHLPPQSHTVPRMEFCLFLFTCFARRRRWTIEARPLDANGNSPFGPKKTCPFPCEAVNPPLDFPRDGSETRLRGDGSLY